MIETNNTKKALERLRKFTDKSLIFEDISKLRLPHKKGPLPYLGATCETEENITIWVSQKSPEATIVHEIIHRILRYEGYPVVEINKNYTLKNIPQQFHNGLPKLQADLSSTIDHPEVFRRLEEDYQLDIEYYYKIQVSQKIDRFKRLLNEGKKANPNAYQFYRQQDILIGLDYFLWRNQSRELLKMFMDNFPSTYQSCFALSRKLKKFDFSNSFEAFNAGKVILKHIENYGKKNSLGSTINKLWSALNIKLPSKTTIK